MSDINMLHEKLSMFSVLKYLNSCDGDGACIKEIVSNTGIGRSHIKEIMNRLIDKNLVCCYKDHTDKSYLTWYYYSNMKNNGGD